MNDAAMNYPGLADEISLLLATETCSLARHLESCSPYLTARTYPVWRDLQHMRQASEQHAERLSRLQEQLELPPRPQPFSSEVANYHYVTLEYLLPKLIAEKRSQIAAYRRAIAHAGRNEQVRTDLESLLADNEAQRASLERALESLDGAAVPAGV